LTEINLAAARHYVANTPVNLPFLRALACWRDVFIMAGNKK
jgi:hypothetical protein